MPEEVGIVFMHIIDCFLFEIEIFSGGKFSIMKGCSMGGIAACDHLTCGVGKGTCYVCTGDMCNAACGKYHFKAAFLVMGLGLGGEWYIEKGEENKYLS
jgi:hypothetical protein